MKTRTAKILVVMNILSWFVFVGLMIKAGAILTSYVVSLINPIATKNLYLKLDLSALREYDFVYYTAMIALMLSVVLLEAYIAYLLIKVLSKIQLQDPFTLEISARLEKISYCILYTWFIAMFHNVYASWLSERVLGFKLEPIPGEFIFFAGIVFIFSQVFKRGVEMQSEQELTV